jgi:nucleoside-diphosphate-sugar epimerase
VRLVAQAVLHKYVCTVSTKIEGKVLLTGASGFIGGRLRDTLLGQGTDVLAIRRKGSPPSKKGRSVELNYDDKAGLDALIRAEKPDYVLHVAGATKGVTYKDFQDANVMPTENLLRAVEAHHPGLKKFVFVSSLTSYGPSPIGKPLDESASRRPVEFYGQSKLEAERAVEARGDKIAWTIVRPAGVYGPGDVDYFNLFREVSKGRNLFFGNRDKWQSAIYVDDLVELILLATLKTEATGRGYFGCDEKPLTWDEFQGHIVRAVGRKVMTLNLPGFTVDIAAVFGELATKFDKKPRLFNRQKAILSAQEAWTCTSAAATRDLGFTPTVFPAEGCERTLKWYRDEKWM